MDREGMPPVEEYMHEHSDEAHVHLELTPATSTRPEELDEVQNAKQGARWGAAGSPQIKHR